MNIDVLVVGCGPAGLMATLALSRLGVDVLAITKYPRLAPTPRAHVTNQRSFEIFRNLGIEERARALSTSYEEMPDQIFLRSLAGEEFGRIKGLGVDDGWNRQASPCAMADLPQTLLEPLLFQTALENGAQIRFSTELISFTQSDDGVTAQLLDHLTGEQFLVHAKYMIGADGGNSRVATALGLPFEGPGKIGGSLNIVFESDLTAHVAYRPGLLYFLVRTSQDAGGAGLGILRCVKPWNRWLMIKGYAAGQQTPALAPADAATIVRDYLGLPDLNLQVTAVDLWDLNSLCATSYQQGRVFCAGDAVHRHAPSNGLGSNTAMQDAWNLAWKLAWVIQGKAGPGLLASYSDERVPVGHRVVTRATRSLDSYTPILSAIGIFPPVAHGQDEPLLTEIAAGSVAGTARRDALHASIRAKVYEFQARGIELNHMYRSAAIADEGQTPAATSNDAELHYLPTTCPGARLPHAWVQRDGHSVSTLDLIGGGRFTLLTGVGGKAWVDAAGIATARFGVEVSGVAIGPGCPVTDLYFSWSEQREISDTGCLLVRPDGYIAWRCPALGDFHPALRLCEILAAVLDRESPRPTLPHAREPDSDAMTKA